MASEPPPLATRALVKTFDATVALDGVDFQLADGEIHALLGENGAGKSTLANILSGIYRPDSGQVLIRGAPVEIRSPADAFEAGIGMVHQHFRLADALTAAENLHIGWDETPRWAGPSELVARTERICERFGLALDARAPVWQLSVGERQRLETVRVLARGARVLLLDEPTAVLTPDEVRDLFEGLRGLRASGRSMVLVTHKLHEVLAIADRVTVMRRGRIVATHHRDEVDAPELARLMTGADAGDRPVRRNVAPGRVVLHAEGVFARGSHGRMAVKDAGLAVREREILGVAGVSGNGQAELAEVLTGLRTCESGRIELDGVEVTNEPPRRFAAAGVGHIPEDRLAAGLVRTAAIRDNAVMRHYRDPELCRHGFRRLAATDAFARELMIESDVRGAERLDAPVGHLSGGNQQKLVAVREARVADRLLIAVLPTRGLDVAAAQSIHRRLIEKRDAGAAVLVVSEDLDELLAISDRIVVMFEGRIVARFDGADIDRAAIGRAMAGLEHGSAVSAA